jgi:putative Holliday junction resolvase
VAPAPSSVLGLDVGAQRIGVAAASLAAGLARPLTTLEHDDGFLSALRTIIKTENAQALVVGLPRGLDGQHTDQTRTVEAFSEELRRQYGLPVHLQDEAVTSKQAETELESRGKPYGRADIDALAATYILEDWLAGQQLKRQEPAA